MNKPLLSEANITAKLLGNMPNFDKLLARWRETQDKETLGAVSSADFKRIGTFQQLADTIYATDNYSKYNNKGHLVIFKGPTKAFVWYSVSDLLRELSNENPDSVDNPVKVKLDDLRSYIEEHGGDEGYNIYLATLYSRTTKKNQEKYGEDDAERRRKVITKLYPIMDKVMVATKADLTGYLNILLKNNNFEKAESYIHRLLNIQQMQSMNANYLAGSEFFRVAYEEAVKKSKLYYDANGQENFDSIDIEKQIAGGNMSVIRTFLYYLKIQLLRPTK